MAIKPIDYCLKPSCNYCQYCIGTMDQLWQKCKDSAKICCNIL